VPRSSSLHCVDKFTEVDFDTHCLSVVDGKPGTFTTLNGKVCCITSPHGQCSVLFCSRPRTEGWPHHRCTFFICLIYLGCAHLHSSPNWLYNRLYELNMLDSYMVVTLFNPLYNRLYHCLRQMKGHQLQCALVDCAYSLNARPVSDFMSVCSYNVPWLFWSSVPTA